MVKEIPYPLPMDSNGRKYHGQPELREVIAAMLVNESKITRKYVFEHLDKQDGDLVSSHRNLRLYSLLGSTLNRLKHYGYIIKEGPYYMLTDYGREHWDIYIKFSRDLDIKMFMKTDSTGKTIYL